MPNMKVVLHKYVDTLLAPTYRQRFIHGLIAKHTTARTEPENWYANLTSWDADDMIAALLLPGVPNSVLQLTPVTYGRIKLRRTIAPTHS